MARSLTARIRRAGIASLAVAAVCGVSAAAASAQDLPDPTRPPVLPGAPASVAAESGPVLQSILMSPQRQLAIISGQSVPLHGKYGDLTLIRMSETEVVLSNGKEQQVLKLFPEFEKKPGQTKAKGHAGSKKNDAVRP